MLAIDNANGVKTQVFNPEGTGSRYSRYYSAKEDIFVDDGGQTQSTLSNHRLLALSGDGFSGLESLEYRESGFTTNKYYYVDNGSGGKLQVVDYQNDPNNINLASDKHDLFAYTGSQLLVPDQVYAFEVQVDDYSLADTTQIHTLEVRDPSDLSRTDTASYVDNASGSRVQITDHTGEQYSFTASRKDLFEYTGTTPVVGDQVYAFEVQVDDYSLADTTQIRR